MVVAVVHSPFVLQDHLVETLRVCLCAASFKKLDNPRHKFWLGLVNLLTLLEEYKIVIACNKNMTYEIPALEPDKAQIRLLRLLPSEDTTSEIICGSLHVVDLDDNPTYAALSYTWEPMNPLHTILIDRQPCTIGDNLWQFLSTATDALREGDMSIWVDQICIDQHSLSERNHQVSQMGRVYSQADQTIVWLGSEAHKSHFAMSFLDDRWHTKASNEAIINKHKELLPIDDLAEAVTLLFQRPYWTRLWVVQEFWLSQYLILLYGSSALRFHEGVIPRARAYLFSSTVTTILQLEAIQIMKQMFAALPSITSLIFLFGDKKSARPHNRGFSLLGHTANEDLIPVNHSVPLEKLALQVLLTLPAAMLNNFDRRVVRSILSGEIKDTAILNLTSEVLFHIARGFIPFAALTAGKDHGSEEVSRMCKQIMESVKDNHKVDMRYIVYDRYSKVSGLEKTPRWFLRRRLGGSWAMRGISKPQTPSEKLTSKTLAQSSKTLARSRATRIKALERSVNGVERTWPDRIRYTFREFFPRKKKQGIKSDARSGQEADEVRNGVKSPSEALPTSELNT